LLFSLIRLHPKPFLWALLGSCVYGGAVVASSFALGEVVDQVVVPRFESAALSQAAMVSGVLLLLAVGLMKTSATVLRRCMAAVAKARSDASLREMVVDRYQALPFEYHQSHPTGELLAHANADPEAAAEVPAKMPLAAGLIVLFAIAGVWIFATDPALAAIGLLIVPALVGLNTVYQRRIELPATNAQHHIGKVSAAAHESIDGALTVKVFGAERAERARFESVARRLRDAKIEIAKRDATFDVLLESISTLAIVALVVVGAWRVNSGAVSVGELVSFINLFTLLTFPLRVIGYVLGDIPPSLAGYDRVRRVLDEQARSPAGSQDVPDGPIGVEVTGLSFGYVAGCPVVDDVSFTVPAGSTLAVVGPTGCGKTTLLVLLARLFQADAGMVLLGGADLAELRPASLTKASALVFQEPFLFAESLEENILLGYRADRPSVTEALRLAAADEFVDLLPAGLATPVGERGVTLSGGQRQRIALARALVRRPRLRLLDDATSAVDPRTEARILRQLAAERTTTTKIVVANRPSTLALADQVIYLEQGKLVRAGTHEQLLASVPGYERLVRAYEIERAGRVP
jgi:ATP-binding cassette, subfamily B, bacterial